MKEYKGYYIDGVIYHNEKEIDEHIKNCAIDAYRIAVELFCKERNIAYAAYVDEKAEELVNKYGFTWEQVEELGSKFMAA